MNSKIALIITAILLSTQAFAGEVTIDEAWSRASAPGQENGFAGMVITSKKDARLIAVSTPAASSAEIHTMTMDNGVMKMRQLENLPLPALQAVKLGPGGDHLMLIGLLTPLKAGDNISLTLTVQFADKRTEKINVKALIKPLTGGVHEHKQHH